MELFVMITVQKQHGNGPVESMHQARTITVAPGSPRMGALAWAIEQLPEHMRDGVIIFFSVEPNRLDAASPAADTIPEPEPAAL